MAGWFEVIRAHHTSKLITQSVPCALLRHRYGPWSARFLEPQGSRSQNGDCRNRVGYLPSNTYRAETSRGNSKKWASSYMP